MNKMRFLCSFLIAMCLIVSISTAFAVDDDVNIVAIEEGDEIVSTVDEEVLTETIEIDPTVPDFNATSSIQEAVNNAKEGDTIQLKDGNYSLGNSTIIIEKNITIKGSDNVYIIGFNEIDGLFKLQDSDDTYVQGATIQGITFKSTFENPTYGDKDSIGGYAITVLSEGAIIKDSKFLNWDKGVYIKSAPNTIIENNYFNGQATSVSNAGKKERGTKAIDIRKAPGTKIINNVFDGPMLDAVSIAGGSSETIVVGNTFINNAYTMYFSGAATLNSVMANNTFITCGHIEDKDGNIVFDVLPVISVEKAADNFKVLNNTFIARDNNILIGAESGNTVHGYPSEIGAIEIADNTVLLSNNTNGYSVVFVRLVSASGSLNPIGDIVLKNNTMAKGVRQFYYWDNSWGSADGDILIPIADPIRTSIVIDSVSDGTLTGSLLQFNGDGIFNAILNYTINGVEKSAKTDGNGEFTIEGANGNISITYAGSSDYAKCGYNLTVNTGKTSELLNTTISVSDLNAEVSDATTLTATLKDMDGKALANKEIIAFIGDKQYPATTNDEGIANISLKFASATTLTGVITFAGDNEYKSSIATSKITVTKKATSITAPKKTFKVKATKKVAITLKSSKNALAKKTVKITVNGKTFSAKTTTKGVATITVKLTKKGTFKYTASFAGDSTYKAISKKGTIIVK